MPKLLQIEVLNGRTVRDIETGEIINEECEDYFDLINSISQIKGTVIAIYEGEIYSYDDETPKIEDEVDYKEYARGKDQFFLCISYIPNDGKKKKKFKKSCKKKHQRKKSKPGRSKKKKISKNR
jgi:hypothetical protein